MAINSVKALEYPEITNEIEIKYRWYKEVLTGEYYPLKDVINEDNIDLTNIKYGKYSLWKKEYCQLSKDNYSIEKKVIIGYQMLYNTRYILLDGYNFNGEIQDNIKIYQEKNLIEFNVISNENGKIKLELNKSYETAKLSFFINGDTNYKITLYRDEKLKKEILSKEIQGDRILIPDETWITNKTQYYINLTEVEEKTSALKKETSRTYECRYREKYVYKYNIQKEYYDENYYVNVDGYIKDNNDYKVYYRGEPITNTIEIIKEKIVTVPKIEYVYIEKENDSSKEIICPNKIKTELVEKEIPVYKIPKNIYLLILILIVLIMLLSIKLCKKYVV